MKKINLTTTLIFLFAALNLNSATHTVTNGNDAGAGSLRQAVFDANSGDTIIFASNVSTVSLTSGQITIDKSLTINGKSKDEKTSIDGNKNYRIFNVPASNIEANLNNLIIENGKTDYRSGAIDIYGGNSNKVKITNCIFRNNEGFSGGAILIAASEVVAVNCVFEQSNDAVISIHPAASFTAINSIFYGNNAAVINYSSNSFIAVNSTFYKNKFDIWGTVSLVGNGCSFVAANCNFIENKSGSGAVYIHNDNKVANLYFSTFDKNEADGSDGHAIHSYGINTLYSYNSIYTGSTEQIVGTISGNGKNLIENGTTVTRDSVFGNNEYENGYIRPLAFARSATPLTKYDIEVPDGMNADDIITWLLTDQIGKNRIPDSNGFVTFGAVECDDVGIRKDGSFDVLVLPNPTDRDFNIIFDNPETQKVSIDLIDIEGKIIFSIFDGVVSAGIQVYRVNENLASSVYFVKFVFGNKVMLRKVVVRK